MLYVNRLLINPGDTSSSPVVMVDCHDARSAYAFARSDQLVRRCRPEHLVLRSSERQFLVVKLLVRQARLVLSRDQRIEHWHNEQGKQGATVMQRSDHVCEAAKVP